jgi:hypothetical protein
VRPRGSAGGASLSACAGKAEEGAVAEPRRLTRTQPACVMSGAQRAPFGLSHLAKCPCRGARSGLRMVLRPPGDAVVPMVLRGRRLAGRELRVLGPSLLPPRASTRISFAVPTRQLPGRSLSESRCRR